MSKPIVASSAARTWGNPRCSHRLPANASPLWRILRAVTRDRIYADAEMDGPRVYACGHRRNRALREDV
jgi:hypothetical protein